MVLMMTWMMTDTKDQESICYSPFVTIQLFSDVIMTSFGTKDTILTS